MHGQNHEDDVIVRHLESISDVERFKPNQFIDIGGYHPEQFSNTRSLVKRGWGGVVVEPAPGNALNFLRFYADNPAIKLVNAAVVARDAKLATFWDSGGDAISTAVESHVHRWAGVARFTPYLTRQITVEELFNIVGYDFSVLSLDVESMNLELFQALPLDKLTKLRALVVEHDGHVDVIRASMRAYDSSWKELALNGENLVFGR
jgi:FkbM family methyltransferase